MTTKFGLFTFIAFAASLCLQANAQTQQYDFSVARLNGIAYNGRYTREQFIEAFGEPDEEDQVIHDYFVYNRKQPPMVAKSASISQEMKPVIVVQDEIGYSINPDGSYELTVFTIYSDKIVLNDYVKVGDHISKVHDMGGVTLDGTLSDGQKYLIWCPAGQYNPAELDWAVCPWFYYDDNGIIKKIQLYYD